MHCSTDRLFESKNATSFVRRVLQYLKNFANERKLAWQQDAIGNMVIKRTGTGGGENANAVVIQV